MKTFDGKPNYLFAVFFVAVSLIFSGCGKLSDGFHPKIQFVREGSFNIDSSVKVGDAFDQFFKNGQWKYFKSTNNEQIVEFTGEFVLADHPDLMFIQFFTGNINALQNPSEKVPTKTAIQFVLNGESFNIRHMEINGSTADTLTIAAMIEKIIKSYKAVPAR